MKKFHVVAAIAFVWLPMDAAFAALNDGNRQRSSETVNETSKIPEGDQTPSLDDAAEEKAGAEAAAPAAEPVAVEVQWRPSPNQAHPMKLTVPRKKS